MRSFSKLLLLCSLALGALSGCGQDPVLVTPPTFERPGAIAFFCYDGVARRPVALTECEDRDLGDERYSLTALVSQTARGEVATVDLRVQSVLDSDVRVPGFTFVRVGEVPLDIELNDENPGVTYVAAFGSRRVEYYATARFREDIDGRAIEQDGWVNLPDGPTDIELNEDGTELYATLPELGAIARIPVLPDGSLGDAEILPLELPETLDAELVAESYDPEERICAETTIPLPVPVSPRAPALAEALARPAQIVVDGATLLIPDETQPLIHRFDISAEAPAALDPILTGSPVTELALTPELALGERPYSRFLYAIDTDGAVLVLGEESVEGGPSTFRVLPVHQGDGAVDRIRLASRATALTVMTPGFEGGDECSLADILGTEASANIGPSAMRGVFLAVGLANGLVQFVDIVDLDASCRGGDQVCSSGSRIDERDAQVYIRENAPRIGAFVTTGTTVSGDPAFEFEGAPGRIDAQGQGVPGGPSLASLESCPDTMKGIFPTATTEGDTSARICATASPWAVRQEVWEARWEGVIPNTRTGFAYFAEEDGERVLRFESGRLCQRGVLGSENVSGLEGAAADYIGDQVAILSDPSSDDAACERFILDSESGLRQDTALLSIVRSEDNRVVIEAEEEVLSCFRGALASTLLEVEVRSQSAYTVIGSTSGFVHSVSADEDGLCVVADPDRFPRAIEGRPFENPYVAFSIESELQSGSEIDALLSFIVGSVPPALVADVGLRSNLARFSTLVREVVYSPTDEHLYVLDSSGDALQEYSLYPLSRERVYE